MYLQKLEQDDCTALLGWWGWLEGNRGDRALLRRVKTPDEVLLTPAFAHFLQKMPGRWSENKAIRLVDAAMVASVISRVKFNDQKHSFAKTLAFHKDGGNKSAMSELRFQQLQKSRTEDEFFIRTCRALDLINRKTSVISLADDILYWLMEFRYGPASKPADRLAVRWASDYYENIKD